ncbi:tetratricopeptide (TPR) repeat protein [Kitasatospora sp. MAP12-15]|uniref:tetratricopeptide repeat protein n=1 Tax=unclassified Kitasatospora TaxID=2633591 RepID=UPI002474E582|nr:tetratricopeptide repeat protein [Kitasatospora sp. MAP12-44]MDH6113530.1 tetratricopeptide (TPR) repeat protein [Kitasatospora sp. MAP12-44]
MSEGQGQGTGGGAERPPVTSGGPGEPQGDVYDWFRRGEQLLATGHPAAAEQLLARAAAAEPDSKSIREALARAQYDAGSYAGAVENFRAIAKADPSDDYAQFGWGIAAARLGDFETSVKHLALAVAMRPEAAHYRAALRQSRATLAARSGAYGPLQPGAPGYVPPQQTESGADAGPPAARDDDPKDEEDHA